MAAAKIPVDEWAQMLQHNCLKALHQGDATTKLRPVAAEAHLLLLWVRLVAVGFFFRLEVGCYMFVCVAELVAEL